MKEYMYVGIIFKKTKINDTVFLNPVDVKKLNILDNNVYDVLDYGILNTVFDKYNGEDELSVGFVITIEQIENYYDDFDSGLEEYKNDVTYDIYFQKESEYEVKTYKTNTLEDSIYEVATFKDNIITYNENMDSEYDEDIYFDVKELYTILKQNIIGQDETIKKVILTISRNLDAKNYRSKTDMLIIGPRNSGKTEIFKSIHEHSNVPITFVNSDRYLRTGFNDYDIFDIIYNLLLEANNDIEKAERGIVVIDNVDILFDDYLEEDNKTLLLKSLLAFIDGNTTRMTLTVNDDSQTITFDSSFVTFAFIGNFEKLTKIKNYGFSADSKERVYKEIKKEDLIDFGLPKEIVNKTSIYRLNELSKEDILKILTESYNSALIEYLRLLITSGVKVKINYEALEKIAQMAYEKKIGANGIKFVLEEIFDNALFEIYMNPDLYSSITITEKTLEKEPPYVLYKKRNIKEKN